MRNVLHSSHPFISSSPSVCSPPEFSTSRLPVRYVFGRLPLDLSDLTTKLSTTFQDKEKLKGKRIVILYDVLYHHLRSSLEERFQEFFKLEDVSVFVTQVLTFTQPYSTISSITSSSSCCAEQKLQKAKTGSCCSSSEGVSSSKDCGSATAPTSCVISPSLPATPPSSSPSGPVEEGAFVELGFCGRLWKPTTTTRLTNDDIIVYIGDQSSSTLTTLLLNFANNKVFGYDPSKQQLREENGQVNRTLQRRFYLGKLTLSVSTSNPLTSFFFLVEKTKDAQTIGLVVGTLGVARYRESLAQLKKEIKSSGRKYYVFVVGKINVPKLANFLEIEVFVLVACPLLSTVDSKDFLAPVITPFELLLALQTGRWKFG
jgi:diphthamide biosynthesis protein 2